MTNASASVLNSKLLQFAQNATKEPNQAEGFSELLKNVTPEKKSVTDSTDISRISRPYNDVAESEDEKAIRLLLEELIDNQKDASSIKELIGDLYDKNTIIEGMIDTLTKKIVDQTITQNNLNPDEETYQAAYKAVRAAVSGETVAAQFGLPKGQVATEALISVADEVALRKEHISKALEKTLGRSL